MYRLLVYFHGPQTEWSGKLCAAELVADYEIQWLWLARLRARRFTKDLNTGRCGYAITLSDQVIEQFEAPWPDLTAPAPVS